MPERLPVRCSNRIPRALVAMQDSSLFNTLMETDPQVLLRSDVALSDFANRARLVTSLLKGFQSELVDDPDWALQNEYRHLEQVLQTLRSQLCLLTADRVRRVRDQENGQLRQQSRYGCILRRMRGQLCGPSLPKTRSSSATQCCEWLTQ